MSRTRINLDERGVAQIFSFGSNTAGKEALVTIDKGTQATSQLVLDVKASAQILGTLFVQNLEVIGNINQQTVTELNVTDKVIRVNNNGTTAAATGSGLEVEGTGGVVIGAIKYSPTSPTLFTIGDGTNQYDLVDTNATQTLANKTLTTPTIGSFVNAAHDHSNAAGGGQLDPANCLSAAVPTTKGGTGLTSVTAFALIAGGATSNANLQSLATGTSGQVLISQGSGAVPTWGAVVDPKFFREVSFTGDQDGVNKVFTLSSAVDTNSELIFWDGVALNRGSANDYTISGTTLTFEAASPAPSADTVIRVYGNY